MEDENLYDEFGNYIGPEMDLSDGGSSSGDEGDDQSRDGVAASPDAGSDYAYERPDGEGLNAGVAPPQM